MFWWTIFGSIFVVIACATYFSIRTRNSTESFTDISQNHSPTKLWDNIDIQYHITEDQLRKSVDHSMNLFMIRGDQGNIVPVYMETTQPFPTYRISGAFRTMIPTYEESIRLSLWKDKAFPSLSGNVVGYSL